MSIDKDWRRVLLGPNPSIVRPTINPNYRDGRYKNPAVILEIKKDNKGERKDMSLRGIEYINFLESHCSHNTMDQHPLTSLEKIKSHMLCGTNYIVEKMISCMVKDQISNELKFMIKVSYMVNKMIKNNLGKEIVISLDYLLYRPENISTIKKYLKYFGVDKRAIIDENIIPFGNKNENGPRVILTTSKQILSSIDQGYVFRDDLIILKPINESLSEIQIWTVIDLFMEKVAQGLENNVLSNQSISFTPVIIDNKLLNKTIIPEITKDINNLLVNASDFIRHHVHTIELKTMNKYYRSGEIINLIAHPKMTGGDNMSKPYLNNTDFLNELSKTPVTNPIEESIGNINEDNTNKIVNSINELNETLKGIEKALNKIANKSNIPPYPGYPSPYNPTCTTSCNTNGSNSYPPEGFIKCETRPRGNQSGIQDELTNKIYTDEQEVSGLAKLVVEAALAQIFKGSKVKNSNEYNYKGVSPKGGESGVR